VALKVLRRETVQDESSVKRFLTEAKAIACLESPHTITLHDFGVTPDGLLYYTMELLRGSPLSKLLRKEGPLDFRRASELVFQTLDSLEEAHERNILHRDLKPDNLFITLKRGKEHATILDFGIAKLVGDQSMDTITRTGMICGTPAYLSPEQALGNEALPASDLYSLGIVFYEMLSGSPPFRNTTAMKVLLQHLNEQPQPIHERNPDVEVPQSLDQFILKALGKEPERRFRSASEFRQGLEEALSAHQERPETVALSPMTTTGGGLRSVSSRHAGDAPSPPEEESATTSPSETADALESQPDTFTRQTSPAGAAEPADSAAHADTGMTPLPLVGSEEGSSDGREDPGQETKIAIDAARSRSWLPWSVAGVLTAALAVLIVVWQPWVGGKNNPEGARKARDDLPGAGVAPAGMSAHSEEDKRTGKEGPAATDQAKARAEPATTADSARRQSREEAEEEAEKNAEAEARKKAEAEARKKAEEEEKKKAEAEATKKAEEEAKKKAEAEATKKAEEEASKEAEAEARKKAGEEAKKKAEAEARKKAEAKAVEEAGIKAEARAKAEAKQKAKADAMNKAAEAKKRAGEEEDGGFRRAKIKKKEEEGDNDFRRGKISK